MEISEYIYNHLNLCRNNRDVSGIDDLRDFFADLPISCNDEEKWPLSGKNDEEQVIYSTARVDNGNLGFSRYLNCIVSFKLPDSELTVAETLECDDGLQIELKSIIKESGMSCSHFLYNLVCRHREFIRAYDAGKKASGVFSRSFLKLNAHSGKVGGVATCGGYVWAVQGFDFASDCEREQARQAFKQYAAVQGVDIKDKDLKLFLKPCHFAAFQCGKKIDGKHLGKAFLLQYSWNGKMLAATKGRDPEEYRYAKAYNENRGSGNNLQLAAMTLNPKYLRMMKKYHDEFSDKMQKNDNIFRRFRLKFRIFG